MAPLPVFHRPMTSLENSRETSLSSGRGGGATTGSSADSGSGFSLPMRGTGIGGKGRPAQSVPRANMTPDSPGTTVTLAGASSSDYLVPLAGMPTRPAGQQQPVDSASQRKSSRESIPASSPSDVPASENEDEEILLRRPSSPLTGEAETSFSCPAPSSTSGRRSGGYTRYKLYLSHFQMIVSNITNFMGCSLETFFTSLLKIWCCFIVLLTLFC